MLRIHTADGRTVAIDLSDERAAQEWVRSSARAPYQQQMRGVTLVHRHAMRAECDNCGARWTQPVGVQYSVPRPLEFRSVQFEAEHVPPEGRVKGGDRAVIYCDDVRLSVMAHAENPAVRISLAKIGKRRFDPRSQNANADSDDR